MHNRYTGCGSGRLVPLFHIGGLCLLGTLLAFQAGARQTGEKAAPVLRDAEPEAAAPVELELQELWRIGGDSDEEGEFFGVIADVLQSDEGEIYLLDEQLSEIKVFDGAGLYLRTIGREGEGPGEFRRPAAIFFMQDGLLGVVQSRPAGIVQLTGDGLPGPVFNMPRSDEGGPRRMEKGDCRGGNLVFSGRSFERRDDGFARMRHLMGLDLEGRVRATYDELRVEMSSARRVNREDDGFEPLWALGPDGRVFASLDFEYRIQVWQPGGELQHVIEPVYAAQMRGAGRLAKRREEMLEQATRFRRNRRHSGGGMSVEVEVADRERGIRWMSVDAAGYLWVLSGRGADEKPEGSLGVFHVYDSEGAFVQSVVLRGQGDPREDLYILGDGRLFVCTEHRSARRAMRGMDSEEDYDEEDLGEPMSMICYRLDWRAP